MNNIVVTLEICTLYKGLPHGIAIIQYTHPEYEWESWKGVGVFNNGKLHGGPFNCINYRFAYSFSNMHNGRPTDGSYFTSFCAVDGDL